MKKILVLVLVLALVCCFATACGDSTKENAEQTATETKTLRLALQSGSETGPTKAAEDAAAAIEERTNGALKIDVYPDQQLGEYTTVYDELMMGTIDMAIISVVDNYDSRLAAGFLPYLASSYDQLHTVLAPDNYLCQQMYNIQHDMGIEFFGFYCEGFVGVLCNEQLKNANVSNADKGLLMRVPTSDVWNNTFVRLGFRTSQIPYSDAYSALQTGLVDGFTGGPAYGIYDGFRDVGQYYYCYDAICENVQILMSSKVFESLTKDQQQIVTEELNKLSDSSIDDAETLEIESRAKLKDAGINVIEFTQSERDAMAKDVRDNVWSQLESQFTPEFIANLKASYNK